MLPDDDVPVAVNESRSPPPSCTASSPSDGSRPIDTPGNRSLKSTASSICQSMPDRISRVRTPLRFPSTNTRKIVPREPGSNLSATVAERLTAAMRACDIRAATYRAAATARERSTMTRLCGMAAAAITASSDDTNINSIRLYPSSDGVSNRGRPRRPQVIARTTTRRTSLLLRGVLCTQRGDRDERFQLEEVLLADPLHVHQVLGLLEAAVLLAILDDAFGGGLADAGQCVELRRGCGIEIDRRQRRRRRSLRCPLRRVLRRETDEAKGCRENQGGNESSHEWPPVAPADAANQRGRMRG